MSGKKNTNILLIVFLALVAVFVITRFTSLGKRDQTLKSDWMEIDTSQVTSLAIYPRAEQGNRIEFTREGNSWTVSREGLTAAANSQAVTSALVSLMNLDPEQLVARSRERWAEYQVNDSLATRVVVMEGKKRSLDVMVGRFQYQPPAQNSYNPYGQNRVSGSTYVRLSGRPETYSVEGFLAMSINQPFNRWRDQRVTNLVPLQVSRIAYDYPADSGFVAEKSGNAWMVAGIQADSTAFARFLTRVSHISFDQFEDEQQPDGDPDFMASFEGDNMAPQRVKAYMVDGGLLVNSTLNPGTWFRVKPEDKVSDLFPGSGKLIAGNPSGS